MLTRLHACAHVCLVHVCACACPRMHAHPPACVRACVLGACVCMRMPAYASSTSRVLMCTFFCVCACMCLCAIVCAGVCTVCARVHVCGCVHVLCLCIDMCAMNAPAHAHGG